MTGRPSRRSLLSAATVCMAGLSGCFGRERDAEETITETLETGDVDRVAVVGGDGSVTVTGEDRETVRVRGVKRAAVRDDLERIRLATDRREGQLSVEVERYVEDGVFSTGPDPILDLQVAVPDTLRVASVEAENGSIEVAGVRGDLSVRSEAGDQTISRVDGAVTAAAGTADIDVTGAATTDDLSTDTGSISTDVRSLEGDASVETNTGSIDATLVRPLDAVIVAATETGAVTADGFDGVDATVDENRFEATLGEGTHTLEIAAETGDVALALEE